MLKRISILCALAFVAMVLAAPAEDAQPDGKSVTNSIGMKLVKISPGEFVMGTGKESPRTREKWTERDADEAPAHKVGISKPFLIGAYEVTNKQYEAFDPKHKEYRGKRGGTRADDEPVTHVSWHDAVAFCAWLSKKEGKPYRLPTEAEWEYACRAGTRTPYSCGDSINHEQANFGLRRSGKGRQFAVAIGSYPANPWGLHDMHGNVAEWCHDWFGPYRAEAQTDPVGRADGIAKVTRGWNTVNTVSKPVVSYLRSANRSGHLPEDGNRYTGFRVVQGAMPATRPTPAEGPQRFQLNVKQERGPVKEIDSTKPLFVDYGKEKKAPTVPADTWGPLHSKWNHYTTCCVCPNGDVLMVWYSTVAEAGRECAQGVSRLRVGADSWEPASVFMAVPDTNCHAPVLLSDGKRIYHLFNQSFHGWDYASLCLRTSDDNGVTWTRPRIILDRDADVPLSQPCSAFVAKDGALVVAVDGDGHRTERIITSRDHGKIWQVSKGDMRAACDKKYVIHPAIYQRRDGSLYAYLRGQFPMPAVVSDDGGESWKMVETPFPGISVGQKPTVLRLKSGAVLFASADSKRASIGGNFVALSLDDGKTWPHVRKLPSVYGYMFLAQAPDGTIYHTAGRGSAINVVAYNEAWLKEGKPLAEFAK